MRLTAAVSALATIASLSGPALAQGLPTAPSLPPLPAPPGPVSPQAAQPARAVPSDREPSPTPGGVPPECSTPTIEDKVFDYSARLIRDTYGRNVYGKLMRVAETDNRGNRRTCAGELSDSDGWTYDIRFVVDRTASDLVNIGYDFSHVRPPPRANAPALAPAPDPAPPAPAGRQP